jgi:hypothetical protein
MPHPSAGDKEPLVDANHVRAAGERALKMFRPGGMALSPERRRAEVDLLCLKSDIFESGLTFEAFVSHFERRWETAVSTGARARAASTALAQTLSPRGGKSERWKARDDMEYDESASVYIWEDGDTAHELEALRGVPITEACCGRMHAFALLENGEAVVPCPAP